MSGGATEYGLKVYGSPSEQHAGANGAIVTRPVMGGGKRKSRKQQKRRSKTSKRRYKKGGSGCGISKGGNRSRRL